MKLNCIHCILNEISAASKRLARWSWHFIQCVGTYFVQHHVIRKLPRFVSHAQVWAELLWTWFSSTGNEHWGDRSKKMKVSFQRLKHDADPDSECPHCEQNQNDGDKSLALLPPTTLALWGNFFDSSFHLCLHAAASKATLTKRSFG